MILADETAESKLTASCFGTMTSYPSLDTLRELVRSYRPEAAFVVQDDSIRITPAP